jgi:hypothetical protein
MIYTANQTTLSSALPTNPLPPIQKRSHAFHIHAVSERAHCDQDNLCDELEFLKFPFRQRIYSDWQIHQACPPGMVTLPSENLTLVTFLTYVSVVRNCVSGLLSRQFKSHKLP